MSVIEPLPWVAEVIGMPLIAAMSTALPVECCGDVADGRVVAVAALSEVTVGFRPEAARNSSVASTRRSIWPVRMSWRPHS